MKYLIMLIVLLSNNIYAQFSIGATIEGTAPLTDRFSRFSPLTGLGVVIGFRPTEKMNVEARISYDLLIAEYRGPGYGLHLSYDVFSPFYLTSNLTFHANEGSSDEGVALTNIFLLGVGLGINTSSHFSIEGSFSLPLQKKFWIYNYDHFTLEQTSEKLTGVVKVILKFHW